MVTDGVIQQLVFLANERGWVVWPSESGKATYDLKRPQAKQPSTEHDGEPEYGWKTIAHVVRFGQPAFTIVINEQSNYQAIEYMAAKASPYSFNGILVENGNAVVYLSP